GQRRAMRRGFGVALACAAAACTLAGPAAASAKKLPHLDLSDASRCDFIAKPSNGRCLMPFPDNYYTVKDKSTSTGRRVNLQTDAMPSNVNGVHVDAGPYNLNDGFSPGQPIVLKVPGLDNPQALANTNAAPINHIGDYKRKKAPVVLIDAK